MYFAIAKDLKRTRCTLSYIYLLYTVVPAMKGLTFCGHRAVSHMGPSEEFELTADSQGAHMKVTAHF